MNYPQQSAQGLASLGRNGDSMLMHVSPREVQGLQGLAMAQGGSLTINPDTGLPEAFKLGRFLTSLLPAAAGFMMGGPGGAALGIKAGTTAATIAPIAAGMATGAAVAGAQGDDMLMGTLMGGFGGYGGGNIATSVDNLGKLSTSQVAGNAGAQAGNVASNAASNVGMANTFGTTAGVPMGNVASNAASNIGMANQFGTTADSSKLLGSFGIKPSQVESIYAGGGFQSPETLASQSANNIGTGFKELTGQGNMSIGDAFDKYFTPVKEGGAGGSKFELASTVGMPVLQEAMRIDPATMIDPEAIRKAEQNKYKDPRTGLLNLTQASPDLRFMATGGTVQSGGVRDLYGTPDNQPTMSSGLGGFGLGRLNDLAGEQAMNQAKTLGYAMGGLTALKPGGYLSGGGDGMSDSIPATIEGKQPARLADGEFVVPADVVSHIGNGSSKAGSQRLYAMLNKVRKARTGHTKQGKQINPSKYMPA